MEFSDFLDLERAHVCRLAILLAMTRTDEEEKELIRIYGERRLKAAATTISGYSMSFEETVIRNVVNLCLHTHLIDRKRSRGPLRAGSGAEHARGGRHWTEFPVQGGGRAEGRRIFSLFLRRSGHASPVEP